MDCRVIQDELFAYAFGTSSDEDRDRTDAHLLTCTACLRVYLRVRRQVEQRDRATSLGARPSDETRRRIRDDVAAIVRPRGVARVHRWLRRPIPLYQSLAVAAVAAGIAISLPQVADSFVRKAPETTARVDMSRSVPPARAIY